MSLVKVKPKDCIKCSFCTKDILRKVVVLYSDKQLSLIGSIAEDGWFTEGNDKLNTLVPCDHKIDIDLELNFIDRNKIELKQELRRLDREYKKLLKYKKEK